MRRLRIIMIALWCVVGLAIFAVLAASLLGFTPSFPVFSAASGDTELVVDESYPLSGIERVSLDLLSDDCEVFVTEGDAIEIKHYVYNIPEDRYARVSVSSGELNVDTSGKIHFGIRLPFQELSRVELHIPKAFAGEMGLNLASGNVTIGGGLSLASLFIDVASGDIVAEQIETSDAKIDVISGNVRFEGGLITDNYAIEIASGDLSVKDSTTGSGSIGMTSGNLSLEGVEIAESLDIDVTSGDVELQLAGEPSLEFTAKKTSGDIEAYFETGDGNWKTYSATIGPGPYKRLNLDVTSGNVEIRN
jgi:lia operon protein LiaG